MSVKKRSSVGQNMTGPKVCVSLEGTTVKEMADEAARANLAGADFVEVRFDRLYLKKPEPQEVEGDDGELHLGVEFRRPVDVASIGVQIILEVSDDLKEWEPADGVIEVVSPGNEGDTMEEVVLCLSEALRHDGERFVRLRIVLPSL